MTMALAHARERQHFHIVHSRTGPCLLIGQYFVYPDGGMMERSNYGFTIEPPADKYQLALVQVQYWEAAFERAADEFNELQETLQRCVYACRKNGLPPPPDTELARLRELKKLVRECQTKLAGHQARAERFMPASMRSRRNAEACVSQASEEFARSLGKIKL